MIREGSNGRDAAESLLRGSAIGFTGSDTPAGCFLASSAISCSDAANDVKQELASIQQGIKSLLRAKIASSVEVGSLPPDTNTEDLAGFTMAVIQGLSTLARDGATREKLMKVVENAMKVWSNKVSSEC